MTTCTICQRPTDAKREAVCHESCRARLDVRLDRLPGLYVLLGAALEPGSAAGDRVSGSREAPIPVRLEPLSLRARGGIVTMLGTWEADWRIERGLSAAPERTHDAHSLAGLVLFLRMQLEWACQSHPAIDEFAGDVHQITRSCYAALGLTSTAMQIGDCPVVLADDGEVCGRRLYADPYADVIRCTWCRAQWERPRWMMLGQMLRENALAMAGGSERVSA